MCWSRDVKFSPWTVQDENNALYAWQSFVCFDHVKRNWVSGLFFLSIYVRKKVKVRCKCQSNDKNSRRVCCGKCSYCEWMIKCYSLSCSWKIGVHGILKRFLCKLYKLNLFLKMSSSFNTFYCNRIGINIVLSIQSSQVHCAQGRQTSNPLLW